MANDKLSDRTRAVTGWGVCAVMALAGNQAQATATTIAEALSGGSHFPTSTDADDDIGGPGVGSLAAAKVVGSSQIFSPQVPGIPVGLQGGSADAMAGATEGTLRASSAVLFSTSPLVRNSGVSRAGATAHWSDFVTVSGSPQMLDSIGYAIAGLSFNGSTDGAILGIGSFGAVGRFHGTGLAPFTDYPSNVVGNCAGWAYCSVAQDDNAGNMLRYTNFGSVVMLTIPVVFGRPVSLSYTLDVTSIANAISDDGDAESFARGDASYFHTVRWTGITGVFDAFGNPVTQFTVSSESGFDYAARATAVSLPSTLGCLLAGLGALAACSRRTARSTAVR